MAKFYVQSGSLRGIVDCFDEECAAVWAVNRAMQKSSSGDLFAGNGEDDEIARYGEGDGIFELSDTIEINERGFDRDDSVIVDLHAAFTQWHQLKKALDAISKSWDDRLAE